MPVTTNGPQHQTVHHHVHPTTNGQISHGVQQIHLHHQQLAGQHGSQCHTVQSNGQRHPSPQQQQQQHRQPNHIIQQGIQQQAQQHPQQPIPSSMVQHQNISQQQNLVQQQNAAIQHEAPSTQQHFSQPPTPDKLVNSPVNHHVNVGTPHSNPSTPHQLPPQQPAPQPQQPRHASPQVLLLPSGQHGYIQANQTQLRPTINLQGMQYINVNSGTVESNAAPQAVMSPGTPATPHPTTQQEFTSPNIKASGGNIAQYTTSQLTPQQYSIIPTSGGIQVPNSNVIMIQPVQAAGGGTQYQLAQLYPLIHAVNPSNGTIAAIPQKLQPSNGTHIDLTKTPNTTCYNVPVPTVKREQTRCMKSPNTPLNVTQCGADKTVFRSPSDDYTLSSAGSDHNMLDHFDPEVISMILNNTNIDNFNLDNQWNHNLFDNPPNSTHSTSSNPSPISAHSPGT